MNIRFLLIRKCGLAILPVIGLLVSSISVSGQNKSTTAVNSDIVDIRTYTKQVDSFIKISKKRYRIFVDVEAGENNKPDRWEEIKTAAKRKALDEENSYNEVAYVWTKNGKVVGANFTFQSESGDWAHFVMYYFRDDGSLAKIHAQLNTFYGDVSIVRDRYYSPSGKLLRSSVRYLDLQSQKPLKRKPKSFFDEPVPVFHSVKELPFHSLL